MNGGREECMHACMRQVNPGKDWIGAHTLLNLLLPHSGYAVGDLGSEFLSTLGDGVVFYTTLRKTNE